MSRCRCGEEAFRQEGESSLLVGGERGFVGGTGEVLSVVIALVGVGAGEMRTGKASDRLTSLLNFIVVVGRGGGSS